MKKIFLTILVFGVLIFTGCTHTTPETPEPDSEMPGNEEMTVGEKRYVGNSPDECARIRFMCAEGTQYFSDEQGCGCEVVAPEEVQQASGGEAECGIFGEGEDAETVNCGNGEICAVVDWVSSTRVARCYPENICDDSMCAVDEQCVILKSFPAQVSCLPLPEEE